MNREELLYILNDWNIWKKDVDIGIIRKDYIKEILNFLESNVIITVIGTRRSGKSYILRQLMYELARKYEKKNLLFVNFEDVRFSELNTKLLDEIFEIYLGELKPDNPFLIMDEIHRIENYEKWLRTIHELKKARIIISGSNSRLLKGELASLLTGRHLDIEVFPLSFKEFLIFNNIIINDKLDIINQKAKIKKLIEDYVAYGGFPEVVLSKNKKELLFSYFEDIITKDILLRYSIKYPTRFNAIARFCISNFGNAISFRNIAKNFEIAVETAEKFLGYLEEVFLIFSIHRFNWKVKEQEKSPRKIYVIDTGLSNAIGFNFSKNHGKQMENIVAIELKRRKKHNYNNWEVYYYKSREGYEVDFVVKEGLKVKQLIQVTYANSRDDIDKREIRALLKASRELKCNDLLVITWDYESEEDGIKFIPLWKWLLVYE